MKLHHNPILLLLIAAFLMNCHIVAQPKFDHYVLRWCDTYAITINEGDITVVTPETLNNEVNR